MNKKELKNQHQDHINQQNSRLYQNYKETFHFKMKLQPIDSNYQLIISIMHLRLHQIFQTCLTEEIVLESNRKEKVHLYPEGIFDLLSKTFHNIQFTEQGNILFQYGMYNKKHTLVLPKKSSSIKLDDVHRQLSEIKQKHRMSIKGLKEEMNELRAEIKAVKELSSISCNEKKHQYMYERSIQQNSAFFTVQTNRKHTHSDKSHHFESQLAKIIDQISSFKQKMMTIDEKVNTMRPQLERVVQEQMKTFYQDNLNLKEELKRLSHTSTIKGQSEKVVPKVIFNEDILKIHHSCSSTHHFQLQAKQHSLTVTKSLQDTWQNDYSRFISQLSIKKGNITRLQFDILSTKNYNIEIGVCSQSTISSVDKKTRIGHQEQDLMYLLWEFIDDSNNKLQFPRGSLKLFYMEVDTINWNLSWFVKQKREPLRKINIPHFLREQNLHPSITIFDYRDSIEFSFAQSI